MLEALLLVFLFLLGIIVGSFVNVTVLRFGFSEKPNSRSHCPHCGKGIRWYDLLPVISFFILGGRCRECGSSISRQYPVVELIVGILYVLTYVSMPIGSSVLALVGFLGVLLFWTALIAVVAYDVKHTLVPLPFVLFLTAGALVVRFSEAVQQASMSPLIDATLGAFILGGFFASVSLLSGGRGMGLGDAYIAFGIGVLLGIMRGIEAVVMGVWIGTIFYVILLTLSRTQLLPRRLRVTMKSELPFAPWLFLGTAMALFTTFSPLDVIGSILNLI
jgi:prepilin signal peptidase PulO-like enzyme (type II secretory pathway)